MIKKILATICAVGLIFASCFVGHKVDSKADTIASPDTEGQQNFSGYYRYDNVMYAPMTRFGYSPVATSGGFSLVTCSVYASVIFNTYLDVFEFGRYFIFSFYCYLPSVQIVSFQQVFRVDNNRRYGVKLVAGDYVTVVAGNYASFFNSYGVGIIEYQKLQGQIDLQLRDSNAASSNDFALTVGGSLTNSVLSVVGVNASASVSDLFNTTISTATNRWTLDLPSVVFFTSSGLIYTQAQYDGYGQQQYQQGQQAGYDKGYAAGLADSENNSFLSLITAVVDAPITAFTSLLNFEILGFNVKNVVLSLLTAALVIACIRFFSGKFV